MGAAERSRQGDQKVILLGKLDILCGLLRLELSKDDVTESEVVRRNA